MSLFVVNRHEEEINEEVADEKSKLDKVFNRIAKKRKLQHKFKENVYKKEAKLQKIDANSDLKYDELNVEDGENYEQSGTIGTDADGLVPEGFTILGKDKFDRGPKVKRVLPRWLMLPKIISIDLQNLQVKAKTFKVLDKDIRRKLKESNIKYIFPVQAEVIPWIIESNRLRSCLQPKDLCVSAPTGSGKTLAFVLPLVQILKEHKVKKIRAMILLPTQDLATQVHNTFLTYCEGTNVVPYLATGASSFGKEQKQLVGNLTGFGYISKVDILICTAGRLVDHIKRTPGFTLENLEYLIIDEADRVLDEVQDDWLYHLEQHINPDGITSTGIKILNIHSLEKRKPFQKLLFSATLSQDPEKLQKLGLFQPKLFTSIIDGAETSGAGILNRFVGKYTVPKELSEKYILSTMDLKPLVLYEFIRSMNMNKILIFVASIESMHRLKILLKKLFADSKKIEEIGSNLERKVRKNLIEKFEKGEIDVLICTDGLARGMDISGIKCVVSYSCPNHLKTYIHRAGRTARAGETGLAVTFLHHAQEQKFKSMLQETSNTNLEEIKIDEESLEPLGKKYQEALDALKRIVIKEEKADSFKKKK